MTYPETTEVYGEGQMKNIKTWAAIAALIVTMILAGMFSGIFVSPQTHTAAAADNKIEHAQIRHDTSERMDQIVIDHKRDMEKVYEMSQDVAGIKATNEAILRELSLMRRDVNRLPR